MTKVTKKFSLILLAVLCLAVCFGALVACNPTDDGVAYTVTVLMPDDSAASGVDVTVKKGNVTIGTKSTDNDGKAVLSLAEDDYTVTLSKLPKHYGVAEDADLTLPKDGRALTIKLVDSYTYKVNLVDYNGEPYYAEGISVIWCTVNTDGSTGNCLEPETLEAGGVAKSSAPLGRYHVKVEGLPTDYKIRDVDADGYHTREFDEELKEITITVVHVDEITTEVVAVKETLTQFGNQEGVLVGIPMDGTAELKYNDSDKFYHLGTEDGPVVVVMITEYNDMDRFGDGALAYFEMVDSRAASYVYNIASEDSPYYVQNLKDYRTFIRGFADYDFGKVPDMQGNYPLIIPEDIETENYYAKFVNDDGVYPLTAELKTFLEDFYKYNKYFVDWNTYDAEEGWLFPCYYYDTDANPSNPSGPSDNSNIIGEYKLVSFTEMVSWQDDDWVMHEELKTFAVGDEYVDETIIEEGFYTLTVTADSFEITQPTPWGAPAVCFSGKLQSNGDGTYTLSNCENQWGESITATLTYNSTTNTLTFVFVQETFDEDWNPVANDYPFVFQKAE